MLVQVWLPMGLVIGIFFALVVLLILAAGKSSPVVGQASNVSLIFLIAPAIILGLLYAFLVGLSIYLVAKLTTKIPSVTRPVQGLFEVIRFKTENISDGIAKPFIKTRSIFAAIRKIFARH